MEQPTNAAGISVVHSLFNITATMILLPFSHVLVRLACLTIPETLEEQEEANERTKDLELLDSRFLDTPGYALKQSRTVAVRMADLAQKTILKAIALLDHYDEKQAKKVQRLEERTDRYEDELGSYLVKLGSRNLSEKESYTVSMLLHCIGDLERISDHAVNIMETAQELYEKKTGFSEKAKKELGVYTEALQEIVASTMDAFSQGDMEKAARIEPLEETMDDLSKRLKKRHVERLKTGECTMLLGFALSDLVTNYERISDHCSNIAIALLQSRTEGYEAHEYLNALQKEQNTDFQKLYRQFQEKYRLP